MSRPFSIMLFAISALVALPAAALELTPGMWEVTMESQMSMMPGARTTTVKQCMEKSEVTPDEFMQDAGNCSFSDVKDSKKTLSYKMSCPSPQGEMTGNASFASHGDTAEGEMHMSMQVNGRSISMENSWQGKRIGECP